MIGSWWWRRPMRDPAMLAAAALRCAVLALCAALVLSDDSVGAHGGLNWLAALALAAMIASLYLPMGWVAAVPIAEAALTATVIATAPQFPQALLPYLVVPTLAAGLRAGLWVAGLAFSVEIVMLTAVAVATGATVTRSNVLLGGQWVMLGLATGLLGAWASSSQRRQPTSRDTYLAAHRLLTRLRDITRALPSGLDEVSLGQHLLGSVRAEVGFDRAVLYVVADRAGEPHDLPSLSVLAAAGSDRVTWSPDLERGLWARVWRRGRGEQAPGTFSDRTVGMSAVLPMRLGERRTGLLAMERLGGQWSHRDLTHVQLLLDDAALRIDSGHIFSDVRALATVEERRRLAREIHDGIAQDLASLGYLVDGIRADTDDPIVLAGLTSLRDELTRLVTELRLSIFDLRTDVQPATGLGAALTSYVRQVGADAALTIHLVLDESLQRLPIEVETELLRIAQEAVTNARKHARAQNLWVTCRVDPPRAFLRIADDGSGLGGPRADSYGLEIMRERAARVGATLSIRNRVGGGTVVETALGGAVATAGIGRRRDAT